MSNIQQGLLIKAVFKLIENKERYSEAARKFIDKFSLVEEGFKFTTFGIMKCKNCEAGHCNNPKCRGTRFFPESFINSVGRGAKEIQQTQNKIFELAKKYPYREVEND